ncbi:hypothetical protein LCGC14_2261900 [marine sediment metagenome]|uniref:Uncharacterized protein n=1 Tax=marine sediment metagenome TaxID=412755 RepID=A0A0F9CZH3_9ZZZZ
MSFPPQGTITRAELNSVEADLAVHLASLNPHLAESLPFLIKGGTFLILPTNAGWTVSKSGSGGTEEGVASQKLWTGNTASSKGMLYSNFTGFSPGASYSKVNWDKKLYFIFRYSRSGADAEAIARVQMKETNAEGALAAKGIGIRADDLALTGESYGTELGEVDLGVALTSGRDQQILIIHDPSVPKIEWYVDGVLEGTQSTAAKIPNGVAGTTSRFVHSIINGVTGGVFAYSLIFHPKLWQER